MKKPTKQTKEYYDYHDCRDYLQKKYGYDERDYAGEFTKPAKNSKAVKALNKEETSYWDFWHHVIRYTEIHNGCFFWMEKEWLEDATEWQKEIIQHYLDEFADEKGVINFYVYW